MTKLQTKGLFQLMANALETEKTWKNTSFEMMSEEYKHFVKIFNFIKLKPFNSNCDTFKATLNLKNEYVNQRIQWFDDNIL